MPMLTIGQVASRAGLRPSAIRYYEAKGLLPIALRKSGKRLYDESILERLGVIEAAKIAGFNLGEIRSVLSTAGKGSPASTWRSAVQVKQGEIDEQMRKLELMKEMLSRLAECGCTSMQACGRAYLAARPKETHP